MKYDEEDNMLLDMISESNEEIKNSLYDRYEDLLSYYIKKYAQLAISNGIEYNELVQEVNLAFVKAISFYNLEKDANFKTFVNLCIRGSICNLLRSSTTNKKKQERQNLSLYYEYNNGKALIDVLEDDLSDPSKKSLEKERIEELLKIIKSKLSPSEVEIFNYLIVGLTINEISDKTGRDAKKVYNTVARIRKKVKDIIGE